MEIPRLYFKREDLNPYGSHKGRSIPVMIDIKAARGARDFAISSSGNAAIAALRHIQKLNAQITDESAKLSLSIFVGEHLDADKKKTLLAEISDSHISISESPRPLQALFAAIQGKKKESLRQSTDDDALAGYESLARELADIPDLSAVFIGTSSGTAAQAIAAYFIAHKRPISVNIVQTTAVHPFIEGPAGEASLATAIVDKIAHRKNALLPLIAAIQGEAFIASNDDICKAQAYLRDKEGIEATPNGALGLAGFMRARDMGRAYTGTVACVITGK